MDRTLAGIASLCLVTDGAADDAETEPSSSAQQSPSSFPAPPGGTFGSNPGCRRPSGRRDLRIRSALAYEIPGRLVLALAVAVVPGVAVDSEVRALHNRSHPRESLFLGVPHVSN